MQQPQYQSNSRPYYSEEENEFFGRDIAIFTSTSPRELVAHPCFGERRCIRSMNPGTWVLRSCILHLARRLLEIDIVDTMSV